MTITQAILLGAILGWICAAASERFLARIDRLPVTDDPQQEYRDARDEVYDQETDTPIHDQLALAALRRDLDEWGTA